MFPRGLPGVALLLLRASVALALLLESFGHRQGLSVWAVGVALLLALALCAGYLTPIAAGLVFVAHALVWSFLEVASAPVAAIVALNAVALAFLGPGAYSVDSYLFGRRVVVIPPS
jgi:hypothetical protein